MSDSSQNQEFAPRKAPFRKMSIGHFNINFKTFPLLAEKPEGLPQIARAIKVLRKAVGDYDKKQKAQFFQGRPDCEAYLKSLSKTLDQSQNLGLYRFPNDLMNSIIDLHKIDQSLLTDSIISSIVENQLSQVTNVDHLYICQCASFFSKVHLKNDNFWNQLKSYITPLTLLSMSASEITNLMRGLSQAGHLTPKLFNSLNNILLKERSNELNFTDIAMLANLYCKNMNKDSLVLLSQRFIELQSQIKPEQISARSISNFFWALTQAHKQIRPEAWGMTIKDFVLKYSTEFTKAQDIAQLLIAINKTKGYINSNLDSNTKEKLNEVVTRLIRYYLSQTQAQNGAKRPTIHEQDLCNILFAAVNLESIPENLIDALTRSFIDNLPIVEPLGIGYCLHALSIKKNLVFKKYSSQILHFLKTYKKITKENIGYLLWVLKQMPSESQEIINQIVEKSIINQNNNLLSSLSLEQFCYTFHCLQVSGNLKETPNLAQRLIETFIQMDLQKLKEPIIFEYSLFYSSLMLYFNYNFTSTKDTSLQELKEKLNDTTITMFKALDGLNGNLKGFGNLVLSISKGNFNDKEIWEYIRKIAAEANFSDLDLHDCIYLLKGFETYGGHNEFYENIKFKLFSERIQKLSLQRLEVLLTKDPAGKQLPKLFAPELKELVSQAQSTQLTQEKQQILRRIQEVVM